MRHETLRRVAGNAAHVLLSDDANPGAMRDAALQLFETFSEFVGLPETPERGTSLPNGEAISPANAARCVTDYRRTSVFAKGVRAALYELTERFPSTRLRVLYAGSGPFAPLMLLPLLGWREAPAGFTLLDVHPPSLDSACRLIDALDLRAQVDGTACVDATSYVPEAKPHLLIAETMQAGLRREPQVAVTARLASHVEPRGVLVPERILVDAAILENLSATEWHLVPLGRVGEVTRERWPRGEPVDIVVPTTTMNAQLVLQTTIDVFGRHHLGPRESGLTIPLLLQPLSPGAPGMTIEFRYHSSGNPEFLWKRTL